MWIFSKTSHFSGKKIPALGFTVIELLVASSIIVIITTVLLFRHERFNSSTILRSLAYSVALSVRQAQAYGTSVRETGAGSAIYPSYGIYFKSGETTHYFMGADSSPTNNIIATDGSEDVSPPSPYTISGGYAIKDFCAWQSNGARHCSSTGEINTLVVRFVRPNPDALFTTDAGATYTRACIEIESPGEDTRTIGITNTGQISVTGSGATCT